MEKIYLVFYKQSYGYDHKEGVEKVFKSKIRAKKYCEKKNNEIGITEDNCREMWRNESNLFYSYEEYILE